MDFSQNCDPNGDLLTEKKTFSHGWFRGMTSTTPTPMSPAMADYERMINGCRFMLKWVYAYIYPSSAIINKKATTVAWGHSEIVEGEKASSH